MSPVSSIQIPGYELIRELGVGGMATVHLAVQTSLDRKVALKVMRRNIEDAEKFEKRFLVEGRTLAKLPHRNIVAVYDIVKSESATYISMEYLEGGTLHDHMASGLSLGEAVAIVVQIAGALQFAHDHSVVHRDLKPANIMFRDPATPVLTDFGIARQQDAQSTRLTQTGMLVGTPTYMSPEQINALEVDGRSDLYSLGVMFFELLTGKPPFQGDSPIAVLMAHLTTAPPLLPAPYEEFQPIMDRMLAKNRDERFSDLKEFTKALKAVVVNNETLWSRLQADPNQSSSEQLRALGFSVSQTVGDALQNPLQARRLQPSSPGFRELPTQGGKLPPQPTAGSAAPRQGSVPVQPPTGVSRATAPPPSREPGRTPARQRPSWLMPALIGFSLVVILALGWVALRQSPEIDPSIKADVDLRLSAIDQRIGRGKLTVLDGDENALDAFAPQRERAPKYARVKQTGDALLAALKLRMQAQIKEGNFLDAESTQRVVADQWPDDVEVVALAEQITKASAFAEQSAKIESLLKAARAAQAAGRDLGATGSYALLAQAALIAPADKGVREMHAAITQRLLRPARDALKSGSLELANQQLGELETQLRTDPAWIALHKQLTDAVARRSLDQKLSGLYAQFDGQINRGQLTDPAADNALQTLEQIRTMDSKHRDLAGRTARLADALVSMARRSLGAGDASAALQQIDVALRLVPGQIAATALKTEAEGKLSGDQRRLVKFIGDARQATMDRRFVSPAGNNAREYVDKALAQDPNNKDALALRDGLPQRIAEAATALAAQGALPEANTLVGEARMLYPTHPALSAVARQLDQQLVAAQREQGRRDQIERILKAAEARPLVEANFFTVLDLSSELLKANPQDVDVLTARRSLINALEESLAMATAVNEVDRVSRLSDGYRQRFPSDAAIEKFRNQLAPTRERIVLAEKTRIETSAGDLVLIAYPWGKVESLTDSARKPVPLPADVTTPLRIRVPAGLYRVTFSHPEGGRSVEQIVQVKQGAQASVATRFARLDAKEYRRRVGL
ncbi:MAG: protein kinase [Pseudomonadota bacterium]|nr:protein kinase [Pseudomonadota bacterium]